MDTTQIQDFRYEVQKSRYIDPRKFLDFLDDVEKTMEELNDIKNDVKELKELMSDLQKGQSILFSDRI